MTNPDNLGPDLTYKGDAVYCQWYAKNHSQIFGF